MRAGTANVGDSVTLGLRPELLTVAPEGPISGRVEVVEQLGSTQLAYATLPDGTTAVADGIADQVLDRASQRVRAEHRT